MSGEIYENSSSRVSVPERVKKSATDRSRRRTRTEYLNDDNSLTGHSQAVCETESDATTGEGPQVSELPSWAASDQSDTTAHTKRQAGMS